MLVSNPVQVAAHEVTGCPLDQRRLDCVRLAAGAFTNLGRDHMDYHPTVEEYHRAKMRLFEELLQTIIHTALFSGFCYTQVADTFQEANGLLHADRTPKIPIEEIALEQLSTRQPCSPCFGPS